LGDYVVINAGLIVEILPEDEALANLALLQELMALDEPEDDFGGQDAEDIFGELLGADWLSTEERLNDQP